MRTEQSHARMHLLHARTRHLVSQAPCGQVPRTQAVPNKRGKTESPQRSNLSSAAREVDWSSAAHNPLWGRP